MKASQVVVKVDKAGTYAGDRVSLIVEGFKAIEGCGEEIFDRCGGICYSTLGHFKHSGFSVINGLHDILGKPIRHFCDVVANNYQPTQKGTFFDYLGVVGGVADSGCRRLKVE